MLKRRAASGLLLHPSSRWQYAYGNQSNSSRDHQRRILQAREQEEDHFPLVKELDGQIRGSLASQRVTNCLSELLRGGLSRSARPSGGGPLLSPTVRSTLPCPVLRLLWAWVRSEFVTGPQVTPYGKARLCVASSMAAACPQLSGSSCFWVTSPIHLFYPVSWAPQHDWVTWA